VVGDRVPRVETGGGSSNDEPGVSFMGSDGLSPSSPELGDVVGVGLLGIDELFCRLFWMLSRRL